MAQSDSNQNEPSKMQKLLNGDSNESPLSRLPHAANAPTPKKVASKPTPAPTNTTVTTKIPKTPKLAAPVASKPQVDENKTSWSSNRFLPTLWTVASVISLLVNIGTVIALIVILQVLGGPKATLSFAQSQADGLLGGLYNNFVKMDEASIKTTIPINQSIPVQFSLNVSGPTDVTLSKDVSISGALVTVNTGGLNINNARANIVLPAGTVLPITIQNLVVPVNQQVQAVFDVPVDIPLSQTELHDPFVGLQKVVEPYYCLLRPNLVVNGINVCANAAPLLPVAPSGTTTP